jgi:hypothetical protein
LLAQYGVLTMTRRFYRDAIDPAEMTDPVLRKNVFRDMARDFVSVMKEGAVSDRPGTIARMMEAAYQAGIEGTSDRTSDTSRGQARRPAKFTEMDVPSLPRDQMSSIRLLLFRSREPWNGTDGSRDPGKEQLALVMRPKVPGMPSTVSRDEWMLACYGQCRTFSNKAVLPLVKLGLYEATEPDANGWRFAFLTEWGFELLATGQTALQDDRTPHSSSTFDRYVACLGDRQIVKAAAVALGLYAPEEAAASIPHPR